MKLLTFDTENSGAHRNKAHWSDARNELVCLSYRVLDTEDSNKNKSGCISQSDLPYLQKDIDEADWIIGFNLKYDINWCRKYGLKFKNKKLWDVQLVHFITQGQKPAYPSLNGVSEYYELPVKLDVVKTEYWDVGLDTDQVPWDILQEYADHDVWLTEQCAIRQMQEFKRLSRQLQATIRTSLEDIHILAEMEWNGFKYDKELSAKLAYEGQTKASSICQELDSLTNTEHLNINWNSSDQVSAVLYGGTIKRVQAETYLFTYANARKAPVEKVRKVEVLYELPRLVEPIRGSELKKEGVWGTSEDVLKTLRPKGKIKKVIDLLLELAKVEKLVSTYFLGYPNKIEYFGGGDYSRTTINQCVTETGRLSSSKVNQQNIPPEHKQCFISRFRHADS